MKKKLTTVLLTLTVLATASFLGACGGGNNETASSPSASPTTEASPSASPTTEASPSSPEAEELSVEEAVLAKKSGGGEGQPNLTPMEDNVFKPGDTVYLVLRNTGKFKAGPDGKHKIEMDVKVTDSSGKVLLSRENLLGDKGEVKLDNDTAPAPYGNVDTTAQTPAGTYTISVTIYDKIGGGKATRSKEFKIES